MARNDPLVSVILPVYNGQKYLKEAVDSILAQTYKNFELIIINDGSTDDSEKVIKSYKDPRIRYYKQENQRLAATLNNGIKYAKGVYIARQDQDDVSVAKRFEKQVEYLNEHPNVGLVGTWASITVENEPTERTLQHPTTNAALQFALLFDNPFVHSSVMLRKGVFGAVGGYSTDKDRQPPEDYELWSRVSRRYELGNVAELLLVYRETSGSMSRDGVNPFMKNILKISAENIAHASHKPVDDPLVQALTSMVHQPTEANYSQPQIMEFLAGLAPHASGKEQEELKAMVYQQKMLIYHYSPLSSGKVKFLARSFLRKLAVKAGVR